jgi:lysophospholipase L1-like esterase
VRAVISSRQKKAKPDAIKANPNKRRVPKEHREKLLKMFQEYCAERDIEFIIIVPWYQTFKKHIALLRIFAVQNNIVIVDLPKALKVPPKKKKRYFRDSTHPNPRGHRMIAEAIAEKLWQLWPDSR